MYLSKLEIFGFKSFQQKTVVNFTKGITVIVGPNGCGKTNIVDAIRWCLGEQKSSTLRSDKMENVIFNGTQNKKPMGMSEVSLTLVNDRGVLPTEYSEVTITRRIFRSGESEYLLNRNICRLKDITNLFMDTGMGTNAYSVIELKMVETILNNKADERRVMFEEAAGVNKYKLRRRLSLKKLEEVKSDLTRVNDIVSEVDKNVRSLERQAKRADKYNQLQSLLRENELDLSEREYSVMVSSRNQLAETKNNLESRKLEIESQINAIDEELTLKRNKLNDEEKIFKEKRSELYSITEKIHTSERIISVSEERLNSLNQNLTRFNTEQTEFHLQLEENKELQLSSSNIIEKLREESILKNRTLSDLDIEVQKKKERLEKVRIEIKSKNDILFEKIKDINNQENKIANLRSSLDTTNYAIEKLNDKILKITNNIAKTVGYLEDLENEKEAANEKLNISEKYYSEKQKEKENHEKELLVLKNQEFELRSIIVGLREKIEFLQSLIINLEGVSKGAKVLLESKGWTEKEKTILADVGNTSDEFRFAMEAALKNSLNTLLIDNYNDLKNAVDYLNKNDLGKASFFLLHNDSRKKSGFFNNLNNFNIKRKVKRVQKEEGFVALPHLIVDSDDKWKSYFQNILSGTVIIDNLLNAFDLIIKYPELNFVTLNGDIVQSNGVIEAGSLPQMDETLFGRRQLLNNLKNDYPVYEKRLKHLLEDISSKEEQISGIDLRVISEQGKILLNDISNIEKQISQFEFEKQKSSDEIDTARNEIQDLVTKSNELDNLIANLSVKLKSHSEEKDILQKEILTNENQLHLIDEDYVREQDEFNNLKIELERLKGKISVTEDDINRSLKNIDSLENSIKKRIQDIEDAQNEILNTNLSVESIRTELKSYDSERSILNSSISEIEEKTKILRTETNEIEKNLSELRKEWQSTSNKLQDISIKLSELNLREENLFNRIKEEYSYELQFKQFDDLDNFDFKYKSDEVHKLKTDLRNLGPINLLSYSEYEEEKERLDFLLKQREDLIESEKDLLKTINEINVTAQTLFSETFEKIRENFIRIFRSLFNPGDEADLKLEEGSDPLEAKIEIVAKPKGKRPTSIELLSGGEKTLTATALLFAIYLVKPSPFCILDEVDAPLDDANIDRFSRLLNDFKENTQFIIVTHNKRTMEAAETLYGVTMQEEGISKLVSVRFNEEIQLN